MTTTALATSTLSAVFATDGAGNTWRVSDPAEYDLSLLTWSQLDDQLRGGLLPQVKHFEVRTVAVGPNRPLVGPEISSHDRYDGAKLNLNMTRPVVKGRGFAKVEDAARAAWKAFAPTYTSWYDRRVNRSGGGRQRTGIQGRGGWFYYPNGQTAAQGLNDLARICKQRQLVTQGADGRWYPYEIEQL